MTCKLGRWRKGALRGTMFCALHCPDGERIPEGCTLSCQWPHVKPSLCPLSDRCPCAQCATAERAEAFLAWRQRAEGELVAEEAVSAE